LDKYLLSVPLIGQLSKNFTDGNDRLISGDDLLGLALERVSASQELVSGRMVYLECTDTPELIGFYERNGFFRIGNRVTDGDASGDDHLVLMIKYL